MGSNASTVQPARRTSLRKRRFDRRAEIGLDAPRRDRPGLTLALYERTSGTWINRNAGGLMPHSSADMALGHAKVGMAWA